MTRGEIAIITSDKKIVTSTEFNGDMYTRNHGRGQEAFDALQSITTEQEYKDFICQFNDKYFNYDEELFYILDDKKHYNWEHNYDNSWFTDYLYIKNVSNESVEFTDYYSKKISLLPHEIAIFIGGGKYFAKTQKEIDAQNASVM